jgi:Fe-S-cluster containining protein
MDDYNPCLSCGVCCTHFRVSFYWAEAEAFLGGVVPVDYTEDINDRFKCMKGTNPQNGEPRRCIALQGEIGQSIYCSIYENRPNPCRDYPLWMEDGSINPKCQELRALYGLPPVDPPFNPPQSPNTSPIEPQVA